MAQKIDPTRGDFVQLVEKDMINLNITEAQVIGYNKVDLKKLFKQSEKDAAFEELKATKEKHIKVKHIVYKDLEMQSYLRCENLCSEEIQTLTALRSQCLRNVRNNFKKMFKNRVQCPLKCDKEYPHTDSQEHLLQCSLLKSGDTLSASIMNEFQNITKQEAIAKIVAKVLRSRKRLIEQLEEHT